MSFPSIPTTFLPTNECLPWRPLCAKSTPLRKKFLSVPVLSSTSCATPRSDFGVSSTSRMADLKSYEVEECRAAFEVYDTTGGGKIDAKWMGALLRALDVTVTQETVKKAGGTEKEGEKMISFEDFLPIYSEAKKSKDMGQIEDLLEGLKVYDKNENGTMMAAELAHVLLSLGEKLNDKEVDEIFTACCPAEDEDGYMKYETFLRSLFAGPFPEEKKEE